jgi:hypothetical protein
VGRGKKIVGEPGVTALCHSVVVLTEGTLAQEKWTPYSVARVLMNLACVLVDSSMVPEEQWIAANAKVMEHRWEHTPMLCRP